MPFDAIRGQEAAVGTLLRALESGRIHHAYRFEGPPGVGKEKAAFALAQALVCTTPPPDGHAFGTGCGTCHACVRAVTFSASPAVPLHPDVVLIERGLYPAATIGRSRDETQDISVDQVRRLVLDRAAFPPHEGRARVVIVRRADELSSSAANALLKTLEEPHEGTHFVLLTSRGDELIDTIRSRTLLVRFGPLPDSLVREILAAKGLAAAEAQAIADLAGGSASLALELADPDASKEREAFVDAVLAAVSGPDLVAALGVAEMRERDKGLLHERLAALASRLWRTARAAAASDPEAAARAAERHAVVLRAMRELARNAQPALLLESMLVRLRRVA